MALFRFYKFNNKHSREDMYIVDYYKPLLDIINKDRKQWNLEPLNKLLFSNYSDSEVMVCDDKEAVIGFIKGNLSDKIIREEYSKFHRDADGYSCSPSRQAFEELERKVNFLITELQELKKVMDIIEE